MKHIGIDCRFAGQNVGLGRYTRDIVTHLLKRDDPIAYKLFVRSVDESWIQELPYRPAIVEAPYKHYSFAEQIYFPRVIRREKIEKMFFPHFNVPLRCPVPFVVTIHDLILHRFSNRAPFHKQLAYLVVMNAAVKRSSRIIAVSKFTASEIFAVYGETASEKCTVTPEAVDDHFVQASQDAIEDLKQRYAIEKDFFLYVGNAKQHKNVQMLIDAYGTLNDDNTDLLLVTFGKEAEKLQLAPGVRILSDVPDVDLPVLYSAAKAFVTASLYEGCGLPVLEARACGCRVIASNCSALPEHEDTGVVLVEPSVENFADAMRHADSLEKPARALWTWEDAAESTADALL